MTEAILHQSNHPAVTNLAESIHESQQTEIEYMTQLLKDRREIPN